MRPLVLNAHADQEIDTLFVMMRGGFRDTWLESKDPHEYLLLSQNVIMASPEPVLGA